MTYKLDEGKDKRPISLQMFSSAQFMSWFIPGIHVHESFVQRIEEK